jgi:hypothetical protein
MLTRGRWPPTGGLTHANTLPRLSIPAPRFSVTNYKGSPNNPINAIFAVSGPTDASLLSPLIQVEQSRTYRVSSFLKIVSNSNYRVQYSIEEFNTTGTLINTITGPNVSNAGTTDSTLDYTPTSPQVIKARLRTSIPPNSGIVAYIDDIRWFAATR